MSDIDNKLLDALRQLGVDVPDKPPTTVQASQTPRNYWHVISGSFDTMVDYRDAQHEIEAVHTSMSPLQPWYLREVNGKACMETPAVKQVTRSEYLDWLKRGLT